ncbi:WD40-repeat-containing domain protein [Trichoderma austrokoningii]
MRRLTNEGLNKTAREAKIKEIVGTATEFIHSLRDIISSAIQAAPQAALAWTGVCVALELLQNPIAATEDNRNGLEYVIKRMDWYWKLSSDVFKENANNNGIANVQHGLGTRLIDLYKALLSYEMKSVCLYYRNRGLVLLRDIAKLDDWKGDIRAIQDLERAFNDGSNTLVDLKMVSNLEQLVTYAEMQSTSQMTKEDQQCMKDLRLTDPSADKKRIEQTKGGLLHDAYSWILENPDYQHWRNNDESRLLWIKGDPGKGKTMLLCGIIDELDQQSVHSGIDHAIYFFCQATDHQLNNAAAVLRGLMFMMINKHPSLISHLRKEYDQAGEKLFEGSNTWIALSDILTAMLQDPALESICLIVDALDECINDLQKLLDFIVDTSSTGGRVRWIVSSRNWSQIEERLQRAEQKAKLSLELNAESISNAVDIYIREKVRRLASLKNYDEETCDAVRIYLSDNANDTFLWVALVCQNLEKYQRWKVLRILREFPPGLDSLYKQMMNQVLSMDDDSDVSLCKQILAIMTSVYRPITLSELSRLIDIPENLSDDIGFLEEIVALCGSFLTIRDGTIYFVHQSAKDHLTSNEEAASAIFPSGSEDVHLAIFSHSIQGMKAILKNNIYGLSDFDNFVNGSISTPDPDPLSPIRYSCIHWLDHLCIGNILELGTGHRSTVEDDGLLDSFLQKHLLHWLESLSLLRHLSDGVISITKLVTLLAARPNRGELLSFLQDTHRFLLYNKRGIEIAPLQIYSAALLFSPMKSLIRNAFLDDIPSWIHNRPINENQWSPCLQTLEGHRHSVDSLIYLGNNRIASASSTEHTIRVWDVITGTCIRTFEKIQKLHSLASLKNSRFASASDDGTIKIWDIITGECALTIVDPDTDLESVASLADERIVTGSKRGLIKIWDLNKSICVQTLEGHNGRIRALDSFGDNWIISGSSDRTIKMWDTLTGKCTQTFGDGTAVRLVACSTNGQIASASYDTIQIWDVAAGGCTRILSSQGIVNSLAYSTDGQMASALEDNTIQIRDAATGICTRTLKGHTERAFSAIFLDNGQLASNSADKTIKIWDIRVATNTEAQTSENHNSPVLKLAMSGDGHFVSASLRDPIRIWDMATGKCVQVLEGHDADRDVSAIDISEDGRLVMSGGSNGLAKGEVKIWDVATGVCIETLETPSEPDIPSVKFSPDGRYAAIPMYNQVDIWDTATWTCIHTLVCHECIETINFSPNGECIASALSDHTISIWDAATGVCVQIIVCDEFFLPQLLAFSADARYIASRSLSDITNVWDLSTGDCIWSRGIGRTRWMSFDARTNSRLYCDLGAVDLDLDVAQASPQVCFRGYGIDQDGEWIVKDGKPMLWLPQEHRAGACIINGSTVVAGCASGRVLVLQFPESGPGF